MTANPPKSGVLRVYNHLTELIESGECPPGEYLPIREEIRAETGASHHNVTDARMKLVDEGKIEAAGPRGYRVTGSPGSGLTLADRMDAVEERLDRLENGDITECP